MKVKFLVTQVGVTTFMPLSYPPPQFLIGFGRIRKLASVRNGGDESPPVHPVAPPLIFTYIHLRFLSLEYQSAATEKEMNIDSEMLLLFIIILTSFQDIYTLPFFLSN